MKSKFVPFLLSALALQSISLCATQPASANYYKHFRHEERKAAKQRMEAQIDFAEGKIGKARMHERKAWRDNVKAHRGF